MSQHIGNHLKNIPRSRTAPPHMGERTISFGALPCCCRFIDSCLTHAGLVRLCLVSLISPQHSYSSQSFQQFCLCLAGVGGIPLWKDSLLLVAVKNWAKIRHIQTRCMEVLVPNAKEGGRSMQEK